MIKNREQWELPKTLPGTSKIWRLEVMALNLFYLVGALIKLCWLT